MNKGTFTFISVCWMPTGSWGVMVRESLGSPGACCPQGEGNKCSAERKEGALFGSTYTNIVGEERGRDSEIPGMAYIIWPSQNLHWFPFCSEFKAKSLNGLQGPTPSGLASFLSGLISYSLLLPPSPTNHHPPHQTQLLYSLPASLFSEKCLGLYSFINSIRIPSSPQHTPLFFPAWKTSPKHIEILRNPWCSLWEWLHSDFLRGFIMSSSPPVPQRCYFSGSGKDPLILHFEKQLNDVVQAPFAKKWEPSEKFQIGSDRIRSGLEGGLGATVLI